MSDQQNIQTENFEKNVFKLCEALGLSPEYCELYSNLLFMNLERAISHREWPSSAISGNENNEYIHTITELSLAIRRSKKELSPEIEIITQNGGVPVIVPFVDDKLNEFFLAEILDPNLRARRDGLVQKFAETEERIETRRRQTERFA